MRENIEKRTTLKNLYSDIRTLLFKMIPEKWDSIYLYASVIDGKKSIVRGEMYFYYYPKSVIKKNPVNVYEIPNKFNINEVEYMKYVTQLYKIIKELRHECIRLENNYWTNITISIENVEFLVEYNDDDLENSIYNSEDRRVIWNYKYLDYPVEKLNRRERKILKRYLEEEEEFGQHQMTIYSETFYQKHIHNDVKYDNERNIYVQDQENKEEKHEVKSQLLKLNK